MKHVLVTGANGHVGYNIVQELLAHGYRVRASVRDPNDDAKSKHLRALTSCSKMDSSSTRSLG